ncbi:MAG: hypothetical protein HYR88_08790 [Verrucomicrobia bacterium]|nr:hypothetical protein [Verrucomicrobiota bacterium]MBI3870228.1 hypothetical protein [Verrucomicrobiota bacterium]
MKPFSPVSRARALAPVLALGLMTSSCLAANWTAGFEEGKPAIKSISQITFGPDAILFVADSKSASIFAIATEDAKAGAPGKMIQVAGINAKAAALLGTTADQVLIDDLAVNPISHTAYLAVSRGRGPDAVPTLIRVKQDSQLEWVNLDRVKFSRVDLPDAPTDTPPAEGRRGANPRVETITDIAFLEDRLLVAGLSNEEFSSTLRSVPFPFKKVARGASVEIYHGAHGRFETRAPIRTFVPFMVGNEPQLLAAYTCTPLVQLPLKDLLPGSKVKGKTIAELGNRNRPIDMIVYQKGGKDYLLLANSSRGVMKVSTDKIEAAENIAEPVKDGSTRGLAYETVKGWTGVDQLDRLDQDTALVLRHSEGSVQNLESLPLP